jgi:hypothetical protein
MLRCAASFVIAAYHKYASFLRICAPCLRTFYKAVSKSTFYEGINFAKSLFLNAMLFRMSQPNMSGSY